MPIVVVGRGYVGEATACERAQDAHAEDEGRELVSGLPGQEIPEADEDEARTGRDGNEHHEEGPLGVLVANGGGDGGEPFLGIPKPLILDDLFVVEGDSDDEGADEGGCGAKSVSQ